jgi:inhibitor of the pro-sigma K processing machinery
VVCVEYGLFIIIAIIVFVVLLRVFSWPMKLIWKLILNGVIGLALLLIFNFLGVYFKVSIPINWVSVLITGFFGVPGLVFLFIFLNL